MSLFLTLLCRMLEGWDDRQWWHSTLLSCSFMYQYTELNRFNKKCPITCELSSTEMTNFQFCLSTDVTFETFQQPKHDTLHDSHRSSAHSLTLSKNSISVFLSNGAFFKCCDLAFHNQRCPSAALIHARLFVSDSTSAELTSEQTFECLLK